ncbi:hypothetical protein B7494_g3587 [Chlorociboria aeruginascens]|nr:hypothetical protein B7494_g3587 [Chlorociboria aeruginascens]
MSSTQLAGNLPPLDRDMSSTQRPGNLPPLDRDMSSTQRPGNLPPLDRDMSSTQRPRNLPPLDRDIMSSTQCPGNSHHPKNIYTQAPNHKSISQNSLASIPTEQQQLINTLQVNIPLDDIITQLKIRIAVLENELAHVKKEKDETVKSSILIARALGGFVSGKNEVNMSGDRDEVRDLQWENQKLKSENGVLWKIVKGRGGDKSDALGKGKDVEREARNDIRHDLKQFAGPKEPLIEEKFALSSFRNQRHTSLNTTQEVAGISKQYNCPKDVAKSGPTQYVPKHQAVARSFGSGSTTLPATPLMASTSSNNSGDDKPIEQWQGRPEARDVGIQDLDEILNDTFPAPDNEVSSRSVSEFTDIDTAVEKQHQALATFQNFPAPNVISTGVDISRSRRGEDYAQGKTSPDHSRNGHHHFTPISIPLGPRNSERFFDKHLPQTSFPLPEDRSIGDALLWSSSEERQMRFDEHKRGELRGSGNHRGRDVHIPDVFIYGVQYRPALEDSNLFRTVLISNLPKDIELRDVLARVRGGIVYSSILADTTSITGSMSALVIFVQEAHAEAYISYASDHPLHFGLSNTQATVTLIDTPTRPTGPRIRRILELEQSRKLMIPSFPQYYSLSRLQNELACGNKYRAASLLELYIDEHQTLHLEFSSVSSASSAFGILSSREIYRYLGAHFVPDPCAGALEELELVLPPRRPIIPRTLIDNSDTSENEILGTGSSEGEGRKRLAALTNQKVEIPQFSGVNLKNSSWADEMEEAESAGVQAEENAKVEEASFLGRIAPANSPANLRTVGSLEIGLLDEMTLIGEEKSAKLLKDISVGMSLECLLSDSDEDVKETKARVIEKTDIFGLASKKDFLDSTTKSEELTIIDGHQPRPKITQTSPTSTPLSSNPTPTSVRETTPPKLPIDPIPTQSHALPTPPGTGTSLIPTKNLPFSLSSTARNWKDEGHRRPPIGLTGSQYAPLVPAFKDSDAGMKRKVLSLRREGASPGQDIAKERGEGKGKEKDKEKVVNEDEIVLDLDEDGGDAE